MSKKRPKITKEEFEKHTKIFREHKNIVVFDVETTGLNSKDGDRIIELGGVNYEMNEHQKFVEKESFNFLIKQDKPLNPEIIEITGITDEMLEKDGVSEDVAYNYFKKFMGDKKTLLMAYNMQFDITFIYHMMLRYQNDFKMTNNLLDVYAIYKDLFSFPWKLEEAIKKLNVEGINSHRASDDAKATYNLFIALVKTKVHEVDAYVNVIGYNKNYGMQGEKFDHIKYVPQMGRWKKLLRMYRGETEFPEEENAKKYRSVVERNATNDKAKKIFEENSENLDALLEELIQAEIWLAKDGPIELKDLDKDHLNRLIGFTEKGIEKYGGSKYWTMSFEEKKYKVNLEDYFNGWLKKLKEKKG